MSAFRTLQDPRSAPECTLSGLVAQHESVDVRGHVRQLGGEMPGSHALARRSRAIEDALEVELGALGCRFRRASPGDLWRRSSAACPRSLATATMTAPRTSTSRAHGAGGRHGLACRDQKHIQAAIAENVPGDCADLRSRSSRRASQAQRSKTDGLGGRGWPKKRRFDPAPPGFPGANVANLWPAAPSERRRVRF